MVYFCYSSFLNVCVAYIFLFWIAIWPLCGKVTASDVSIRVQLFRVCISFPLMSLMGGVGELYRFLIIAFLSILS